MKNRVIIALWRGVLVLVIALVASISIIGGIFARYGTAGNDSTTGKVAAMDTQIDYKEVISAETQLVAFGESSRSVIPFYVDNSANEVASSVYITVSHKGILPLSFSLYSSSVGSIVGSSPITPKSVSDTEVIYIVNMGLQSSDFTLVVEWGSDVYYEYWNGLSDTVKLGVVSVQNNSLEGDGL